MLGLLVDVANSNALRLTLYASAAAACGIAGWREKRRSDAVSAAAVWMLAGAVMVILGVGRETQLGARLTSVGRDLARANGWYPERRPVQRQADVLIGVLTLGGIAAAAFLLRQMRHAQLVAACLVVLLSGFVLVRLISYHDVDQLLYNRPWHGVRVNSFVECGLTTGITVVALTSIVRGGTPANGTYARDAFAASD